jgi:hypothetical protein
MGLLIFKDKVCKKRACFVLSLLRPVIISLMVVVFVATSALSVGIAYHETGRMWFAELSLVLILVILLLVVVVVRVTDILKIM